MNLSLLSILIGAILLGIHFLGWLAPHLSMATACAFPRSRIYGTVLLAFTVLWLLFIVGTTDLGEFSPIRKIIMTAVIIGAFLLWKFVPDFLSSRALGFLLLLIAHPVLEVTFLQQGVLHFSLALLAYGWVLLGLFFVGMPYLHRDFIAWVCEKKSRWNLACWAGMLTGLFLLIEGISREFLA